MIKEREKEEERRIEIGKEKLRREWRGFKAKFE